MKKYVVHKELPGYSIGEAIERMEDFPYYFDLLLREGFLFELPEKKTLEEKIKDVYLLCDGVPKVIAQIAEQHHIDEGWVKPDIFNHNFVEWAKRNGYVKKSDVLEAFDKAWYDIYFAKTGAYEHLRQVLERI